MIRSDRTFEKDVHEADDLGTTILAVGFLAVPVLLMVHFMSGPEIVPEPEPVIEPTSLLLADPLPDPAVISKGPFPERLEKPGFLETRPVQWVRPDPERGRFGITGLEPGTGPDDPRRSRGPGLLRPDARPVHVRLVGPAIGKRAVDASRSLLKRLRIENLP